MTADRTATRADALTDSNHDAPSGAQSADDSKNTTQINPKGESK